MTESRITFPCGDRRLEGLIALPEGEAPGAAVVCHPHPLYGGSMYNNVVEAVLEALWRQGFATLRFNFRGVGDSDGEYDGGEGELDDAREAVAFLAGQATVQSVMLAGYSFGASVSLRAGLSDPAVNRLVLVALPVAMMNGGPNDSTSKPVLLVSGDRDSFSPVEPLRTLASRLGGRTRLEILAGADHFFGGYEARLSALIGAALAEG
jgi:alpha/beta superfamily hydrolase